MNTKLLKSKKDKRLVVCPVCHSVCNKLNGEYYCTACGYSSNKPKAPRRPAIDVESNDNKASGENTDKEQLSLALGSAEYKERQRDLYESSAQREDDAFHKELEDYNEIQAEDVREHNRESDAQNDVTDRKYRMEQKKRGEFKATKKQAAKAAAMTPSKKDDDVISHVDRSDVEDFVYDDGVTEDDYVPSFMSRYL